MVIGKVRLQSLVVSWLILCCLSSIFADTTAESRNSLQRRYSSSPERDKRSIQSSERRRALHEVEARELAGKIVEPRIARDESRERNGRNIRQGERRQAERRYQRVAERRQSPERETRFNREDQRRVSREEERRISREVRIREKRAVRDDDNRRRVSRVRVNREDDRRIRQERRRDVSARENRENRKVEREVIDSENRQRRQNRASRGEQRQTREVRKDERQSQRRVVREIPEERRVASLEKKSARQTRDVSGINNDARYFEKADDAAELAKNENTRVPLSEIITDLSLNDKEVFAKENKFEDNHDWQWNRVSASTLIGVIGFTLLLPSTGKKID